MKTELIISAVVIIFMTTMLNKAFHNCNPFNQVESVLVTPKPIHPRQ